MLNSECLNLPGYDPLVITAMRFQKKPHNRVSGCNEPQAWLPSSSRFRKGASMRNLGLVHHGAATLERVFQGLFAFDVCLRGRVAVERQTAVRSDPSTSPTG